MIDDEFQYIRDENGKILFALVDYEAFQEFKSARTHLEHTEDLLRALTEDEELPELIDADIVHRIAEGENPVRVWREYRGLKAVELAKSAGISAAYLSEIETGKKDGTFKTMAAIAAILNIRLDDLAPPQNASEQKSHNQQFRLKAIKAHTQKLNRLIHTRDSFDTAAVRSMAFKIKSHIEQIEVEDMKADWLMETHETVHRILQLIDEAEKKILKTASSTREQLVDAFENYSPQASCREGSSEKSVEEIFSKKRSSSAA